MKTLVVYDSVFGNTKQIATAIGNSFDVNDEVEVLQVNNVNLEKLSDIELLIVGSPTRAFRPTKEISSFIDKMPSGLLDNVNVMAFDTRVSTVDINSKLLNVMVKFFGYAAEPIGNKLVKKGGKLICLPEGFYVKESEGPLKDKELERASDWVKKRGIQNS